MWEYNNELYHFGILGMRWGVRRGQKQIDKLSKNIDGSLRSYDKGSRLVDANTFRDLSRKNRKLNYKANKRISRINSYLNRTKGESVNNILLKIEKNPEKIAKAKDYLERNQLLTKKLSEMRTSLMDVKLDML